MKLTQPLKWHGGKRYLAAKIIALMPRHLHYVEPFAGGLAVLFARDPNDPAMQWGTNGDTKGVSEIVNDLDGALANFWRVLAGPDLFPEFFRRVNCIPVGRDIWEEATDYLADEDVCDSDPIAAAVAFFVHCRQSRSGMRKGFTSLTRKRTRRGMNGNVSEWLGAVDGLPDVHQRLRRVVVENMDAVKLIRREDEPTTFFYLDPPYCHETRATTDSYQHEMTEEQHRNLLHVLSGIEGKFILSGYESALYNSFARRNNWRREDIDIANHAAGGKSKRRMQECLWMNY